MIDVAAVPREKLDDPWRRLPWLAPLALALWGALLLGFALVLQEGGRAPQPIERLDARLIDLPAPLPVPAGGLQGAAQPAPPAAAPPVAAPQPHVEKERVKPHPVRAKKRKAAPPTVYDARGAHTAPAPGTESAAPRAADTHSATTGGPSRPGGGLGADNVGARALYAPKPQIPDDLRDEVFETVAVAHFHVGFDGNAEVSLTQPTSNPRLNTILLDALKQWRFFPAMRNGVAIDSEFDVRIPISVR